MATIKINYGGTTYSMVKTSSKITTPSVKIDGGWIPCFKGDRFAEITYGDQIYTLSPLMVNGYRMACGSKAAVQKDVQKSLTGTLSATLTNTDGTATKTVTKGYNSYSDEGRSNSSTEDYVSNGTDTFTYGVTFNSNPRVTTSDSRYYKVSRVTTTNATISKYAYRRVNSYDGHEYRYTKKAPAGSATATGQIISSKVVSKTVSKTVNYGVTYKDVPTISNVVGCIVSDIGTTACTVTTTLSTTLSSGQSTTLSSNFSFDVIGDVIISSKD